MRGGQCLLGIASLDTRFFTREHHQHGILLRRRRMVVFWPFWFSRPLPHHISLHQPLSRFLTPPAQLVCLRPSHSPAQRLWLFFFFLRRSIGGQERSRTASIQKCLNLCQFHLRSGQLLVWTCDGYSRLVRYLLSSEKTCKCEPTGSFPYGLDSIRIGLEHAPKTSKFE